MMKYRIEHKTNYRYSEPASLSQNELILTPRATETQKVDSSRLEIRPEPQYWDNRTDYFGNYVRAFMVQHPHAELSMTATSQVDTSPSNPPAAESTPPCDQRQL